MVIWRFIKDQAGATMVEMTLVISLLLVLVLGFVDFANAFYQWNAANAAVQLGTRYAAVSAPIAQASILTNAATNDPDLIGETMPSGSFRFVCNSAGCGPNAGFDAATYAELVTKMQDRFPQLEDDNVQVIYEATGLGYWTRPGGAVPSISVSIEGQPFDFFFLPDLPGFDGMQNQITMPNMQSTRTGEDLWTCGNDRSRSPPECQDS